MSLVAFSNGLLFPSGILGCSALEEPPVRRVRSGPRPTGRPARRPEALRERAPELQHEEELERWDGLS